MSTLPLRSPATNGQRLSGKLRSVLQVSPRDVFGGAESVAWNLAEGARRRGLQSWLAVGHKTSRDANVFAIPQPVESYGFWGRFWLRTHARFRNSRRRGAYRMATISRWLAEPMRAWERRNGIEDFRFPGCSKLLQLGPLQPDVIHCHNLHGGYFDLRLFPGLSPQLPIVLTLHDSWLLTGHCSHSMECDRWKRGCGSCPDLTLYPAVARDATAHNWRRKRNIYAASRLYVATPCRWLMDRVERSMLAAGVVESRVIPNGVDLTVFCPGDRYDVRSRLDLPHDARILLFAANQWIRESRAKDYATLRDAVSQIGTRMPGRRVIMVALGETAPNERIGNADIQFVPFQKDPAVVADFYRAADVYVHSAHVDTFPTTILEALACGTPVVATAVCGIPEQINGWRTEATANPWNRHELDDATGILVPPASAGAMAAATIRILTDETAQSRLAVNARKDAGKRFDLDRQVNDYLAWYEEILTRHPSRQTT